jgi:hypothetical protein
VGLSATGYTAFRVALDLRADAVIAFSPVTSLASADMETDGRLPAQRQRVIQGLPEFTRDIVPELAARDCCKRIRAYFGDGNREDRWHADRLCRVPGIELRTIADLASHDSLGELLLQGQAGALADFLLEIRAVGRA